MRLAEIYVAAEHALQKTISDADLWKSLSSVEEFEVLKLSCTRHAFVTPIPEISLFDAFNQCRIYFHKFDFQPNQEFIPLLKKEV